MPTPAPIYTDGDFTAAAAVNTPNLSQPFPGDKGAYVLTQDFMQFSANFTPLDLNTPHPDFADYVLTGEGKPSDLGGGIQRWTRTYCKVPATRSDGGSISYQFIGFTSQITQISDTITANLPGRPRFTRTVNARIQHDYFLVGTGGTYADETEIPLSIEQQYYIPTGYTKDDNGTVTFTPTYPAGNPLQALTGLKVDFINDTITLDDINFTTITSSIPSRTEYTNWIINGTEIIAEGSKINRWQGNIWDRVTTYIVAQ